ncbi:MAG TPA: HAD family phosphatase [Iamia sp.]|nr:HAD family phosphatase [Iamia sp.]
MGDLAAVIFDFDGTLADTEWPIYERARVAAEGLGADLTPELWATHAVGVSHGESYWEALAAAMGAGFDEATFDAAREAVTEVPTSRDSATITPGAAELVHALHAEGVRLAVASGSHREWLEHHLARFGLTDRFVHLVGIDHPGVRAGKPAPDLYDAAVAELGVDPAATVAVEDTRRGIESAQAARLAAVVAVPTRLTAHQDLSGADLVVASLAELTPEGLAALV